VQKITGYFERVAAIYQTVLAYEDGSIASHIKDRYAAAEYLKYVPVLQQHLAPRATVLDWGAQYGHISALLESFGFRPTSYVVRPTPGAVAALERQFPGRWVKSEEAIALPFQDGTFDAVVSSGVFEHVPEYGGCFTGSVREICRVLKPGGHFILWKLPQPAALSEIKSDLIGKWSHPFRFTPNGISMLLERDGFDVVSIECDGIMFASINVLLRKARMSVITRGLDALAKLWPFRVFANDLVVVAKKR